MIQRLCAYLASTQVWTSIFRHGMPWDRRNRVLAVTSNLFLHLHPVAIRKSGLRLTFTWCMGGLTFFLFIVEAITGILLMFYYRPVPEYAFSDVVAMRAHLTMGLLREIHRWGAHAMVIAVWLHMLRVFLTGSYKPPREFNWGVGVVLLVLTMFMSYTGYLLPWDQLAIWAITVGSNMGKAMPVLGMQGPFSDVLMLPGGVPLITTRSDASYMLLAGTSVGGPALLRFYVLHCAALPVIATVLMGVHFWRVRKDGGISGPM